RSCRCNRYTAALTAIPSTHSTWFPASTASARASGMTFALRLWYLTSIRTGSGGNMQPRHDASASDAAHRRDTKARELRLERPGKPFAARSVTMALMATATLERAVGTAARAADTASMRRADLAWLSLWMAGTLL